MKIVQLVYSLSSGGAERFVVDLSNELSRQGHEVHLVIFRSGPGMEFYRFLVDDAVHFHNMKIKEGFGLFRAFKVMRVLTRINPHVVNLHLNVIPYVYVLALLRRNIRFFHTLHNIAQKTVKGRYQPIINRFFYKRNIIQPVAISETANESYSGFYGLPGAVVIDNGRSQVVATDLYESVRSEVLSLLDGARKPVFVHVARYHSSKNQDLLVSAFNRLHEEGVDFLLLVIGNGFDQTPEARALVERACDSIKFLGEKRNVGDYLISADAFCLSSYYEGLPISLLEAFSAGCVPICTAVGGIRDVITDGITGYLSEALDVESYCYAIRRYIDDPDAIDKQFLKTFFNENYSIRICCSSYVALYEQ